MIRLEKDVRMDGGVRLDAEMDAMGRMLWRLTAFLVAVLIAAHCFGLADRSPERRATMERITEVR